MWYSSANDLLKLVAYTNFPEELNDMYLIIVIEILV